MEYICDEYASAVVVAIVIVFSTDLMEFASIAELTVIRLVALLGPPRSLNGLLAHTTLLYRIQCNRECIRLDYINLLICDE